MDIQLHNTLLPLLPQWDDLAENYYQRSEFLLHAERHNACRQRYYAAVKDGQIMAGAIVYSLKIDLLTYLRIPSPFSMQVIGIPCSVSSPGIFGTRDYQRLLLDHLFQTEKGLILGLNFVEKPRLPGLASGKTLPAIVFSNTFATYNDYRNSLRHGYRRRLNRIHENSESLKIASAPMNTFSEEMYGQYLSVFKRSKGKLEKLSLPFFRELPERFQLTTARLDSRLAGWNITLRDGNRLNFFMGGLDYALNSTHQVYYRLLDEIIRKGIGEKASYIDLGQTAEIPKMRTGASPRTLYMAARHSFPLFHRMLSVFAGQLEYRADHEVPSVFKMLR